MPMAMMGRNKITKLMMLRITVTTMMLLVVALLLGATLPLGLSLTVLCRFLRDFVDCVVRDA